MPQGYANNGGSGFGQGSGPPSGPSGPGNNLNPGNNFNQGDDFKELVRSHTDIVSLVGEKVALRPEGGGKFKGLCPFHEDSNPSFTVSPDYGSYKCWACNEAGDAFSFVMKIEKLDFRGALEYLARRAGLEMPTFGSGPKGPKRDEQLAALEWANSQFVNALWDGVAGEAARDYFRERDYTDETIEQWGLGFHPEDWAYLLNRARNNFSIEILDAARLIKKSERSGDWHDQFVGRVMFPIRNDRGQIVAFGGRVLPNADGNDRGPKYLNSSESPYFSKQRILYGLDIAKHFLEEAGRAIVVEGYTDCITLHQAGITNAVGVLGTALTEHHARLLKRFTNQVVLIFDGDEAGQKAAERSLATLLTSELDVRVMTLPGGLDPDEFLAEYGTEDLQQRAASAVEAWRWKFDQAVLRHGLDTLDGRNRVLDEMLRIFVGVASNNVRLDMLLATIAERVGVSEQAVRQRLADVRNHAASRQQNVNSSDNQAVSGRVRQFVDRVLTQPNRDDRIERTLLEELLASPEHFSIASENVAPDDFRNEALRRLFLAMTAVAQGLQDQSGNTSQPQLFPNYENVMAKLNHPEIKRLLIALDESVRERHRRVAPSTQIVLQGRHPDVGSTPIEFPDACPPVLRRPIEQIRWRRDEQSHRQLARQLDDPAAGPRLEESDEALLRVAEFHRRRASGGPKGPPG